ncbi:hypothetical protein GCM10023220_14160 [Streptomyces ziwulingensis]|uniref:Uncharacterized protein n=1 Tax=Streptomyces ziwulingensis TaxID=1045501 RepID=A0ABP9B7D3_9ACTN
MSGFSTGGFGALKYAAKYYGHSASVSAHSGPASQRRDNGIVAHWANASSAALLPVAAGTTPAAAGTAVSASAGPAAGFVSQPFHSGHKGVGIANDIE